MFLHWLVPLLLLVLLQLHFFFTLLFYILFLYELCCFNRHAWHEATKTQTRTKSHDELTTGAGTWSFRLRYFVCSVFDGGISPRLHLEAFAILN